MPSQRKAVLLTDFVSSETYTCKLSVQKSFPKVLVLALKKFTTAPGPESC